MELAYRIDRAASADRKIGHVERLTSVLGIVAAQRQKVPEIDSEHVIGIASQVALDHCRIDAVEPGRNRSMGCKEIAGARSGQRNLERLSVLDHEFTCAFEYGKSRVAFVQMADFRFETDGAEQSPAADAEHQLLLQAQFFPAAI
ncbi:MAG TPA: hypothetical protein VMI09_01420 [Candidatus Binataceae bacterium]|nr:hypothetical protein [Candidatus Binataceae bacterium]